MPSSSLHQQFRNPISALALSACTGGASPCAGQPDVRTVESAALHHDLLSCTLKLDLFCQLFSFSCSLKSLLFSCCLLSPDPSPHRRNLAVHALLRARPSVVTSCLERGGKALALTSCSGAIACLRHRQDSGLIPVCDPPWEASAVANSVEILSSTCSIFDRFEYEFGARQAHFTAVNTNPCRRSTCDGATAMMALRRLGGSSFRPSARTTSGLAGGALRRPRKQGADLWIAVFRGPFRR